MRWSPEEEEFIVQNLGELNYDEMAQAINTKYENNVPGFSTTRTKHAVRHKIARDKITPNVTSYEDSWQYIIKNAKKYREKSMKKDLGLTTSKNTKILSFSDLHVPFFLWEDMQKAIEIHSDANIVVLNGDILDAYIFSTFSKSKSIAAIKEYKMAFDLVHYLSDHFQKVVLVSGNHDYRTTGLVKKPALIKTLLLFLAQIFCLKFLMAKN